ncbi:MAG: hypothetical protein RRC07_13375 [Anaerolineae bacterium]|nr:hypothetical protein [Anaerolineae bacterium]
MFIALYNWIGTPVANLLLLGATAQQADGYPWWYWLVGLSILLLFLFVVVVALAWKDANRPDGEG